MRVMATFLLIWDILPPLTHSWRWHSFFCCQVYCTVCLCILLSSQLFFHERRRWRWGGVRLQIREVGQEGPRWAQPPYFLDGWKQIVRCSWQCPGTSVPSAAHLTVTLYLCSSRSDARGESRALEGRRVSSKSPSRVLDGDKWVAVRNYRK